jgi:hypothetical protein
MNPSAIQAEKLIKLVQGASKALTAQIEEGLPGLPWHPRLRAAVEQDLEAQLGPIVAGVCERLVLAAVTPGLTFEGDDEATGDCRS